MRYDLDTSAIRQRGTTSRLWASLLVPLLLAALAPLQVACAAKTRDRESKRSSGQSTDQENLSFKTPEALYDALVSACKAKDGEKLWAMSLPHFREEMNREATRLGSALSREPALLKTAYPSYTGAPNDFDGRALLIASVKLDDSAKNPCADAAQWKLGRHESEKESPMPATHIFTVERPGNWGFGIRVLADDKGKWRLYEITKAFNLQPPSLRACTWAGLMSFRLTWDKGWKYWDEERFRKECQFDRIPTLVESQFESTDSKSSKRTKSTYRPTKHFSNSDQCEVVYDGKDSGMPNDDIKLSIIFSEKDGVLKGKGRYEVVTGRRNFGDGTAGYSTCVIPSIVTGSRSP